jgi:hypothetical protein
MGAHRSVIQKKQPDLSPSPRDRFCHANKNPGEFLNLPEILPNGANLHAATKKTVNDLQAGLPL